MVGGGERGKIEGRGIVIIISPARPPSVGYRGSDSRTQIRV